MIKIFIADETAPIHIQESRLTQTADYFAAAFRHEIETGILRFPEDSLTAWKVLLHWIHEKRLPEIPCGKDSCRWLNFVRCWCLGDKYDIAKFQDEVMLESWESISCDCKDYLEALREAFEQSPAGSKMRKIQAWCIASAVEKSEEGNLCSASSLDDFDDIPGLWRAVVDALSLRLSGGKEWFYSRDRLEDFLLLEESKIAWRKRLEHDDGRAE